MEGAGSGSESERARLDGVRLGKIVRSLYSGKNCVEDGVPRRLFSKTQVQLGILEWIVGE